MIIALEPQKSRFFMPSDFRTEQRNAFDPQRGALGTQHCLEWSSLSKSWTPELFVEPQNALDPQSSWSSKIWWRSQDPGRALQFSDLLRQKAKWWTWILTGSENLEKLWNPEESSNNDKIQKTDRISCFLGAWALCELKSPASGAFGARLYFLISILLLVYFRIMTK